MLVAAGLLDVVQTRHRSGYVADSGAQHGPVTVEDVRREHWAPGRHRQSTARALQPGRLEPSADLHELPAVAERPHIPMLVPEAVHAVLMDEQLRRPTHDHGSRVSHAHSLDLP